MASLIEARRLVVKIGSALLVEAGEPDDAGVERHVVGGAAGGHVVRLATSPQRVGHADVHQLQEARVGAVADLAAQLGSSAEAVHISTFLDSGLNRTCIVTHGRGAE